MVERRRGRVCGDDTRSDAEGEEIETLGVKPKDALHLASAEKAGCDWFLTTDKRLLKKVAVLGKMKIVNPIQFISEECNENI